jgi:hypothetical protein
MRTRFLEMMIAALLGVTWIPGIAQSAPNPDRVNAIRAKLSQIGDRYSQLPPNHRILADGAKRMAQLALVYDKLAASASKPGSRKAFVHAMAMADNDAGVATVNDNSTDLDFSSYDGVTQSETHTAMCGNQVVVGFNDSGSEFQSAFFGTGGLSFSGAAVSSDGGRTFHDIGVMNPGSDFSNFLSGDPLVTCTNSSTFFYVQLFETGTDSAIAISKSTDGGNTWGDPQEAVGKPAFTLVPPFFIVAAHFLDKPWTVIDPKNPQRIFITYTDFDDTNTSPLVGPGAVCGKQPRTAIEMVVSNDGGQTFGAPIVIDEVCGANVAVQASHVAVNSRGVAYVAWERFNPTTMDIRIRSVGPNGIPGPAVVVDQKVAGGDTFLLNRGVFFGVLEVETDLQGEFRDLVGLDLAVDHSGGPNDGTVYVTWDDGRNKSVPDLAGFTIEGLPPDQPGILLPFSQLILTAGNYAYTDVLVSRSRDGVNFLPAVQVNSDRQPKFGGGHDHFQPAIATDATGQVAICWYDRRNDPRNFQIERFCAESKNRGNDWTNFRVPVSPFSPLHRIDFLVNPAYMGDYDGLTSDFTGKTPGFVGAFEWMSSGMNPDVKAFRF